METEIKSEKFYKAVALFSAAMATLSGFIFLLSWHMGWTQVLLFYPSIEVVSYGSSWGIFLAGLAIFALFLPTSIHYANILGATIALLAISRIIELSFNVKFSITELVSRWITIPQLTTSLMPGVSLIGFILIGIVLTGWTRSKRYPLQSTLTLLASYIVLLLGISGALSYIIPPQLSFIWRGTPLNFYSQLSVIFIGIGLIASANYFDTIRKISLTSHVPILVTVVLSALTIAASWSIALEKIHFVEEIIQSRLNEIKTRSDSLIQEDINLAHQLSSLLKLDITHSLTAKSAEFLSYLQTQKELQSLIWMDENLIVRDIIPKDLHPDRLYKPLSLSAAENKELLQAISKKEIFMTTVPSKNGASYDLLIFSPIYSEQTFKGLIAVEVDLKTLFEMSFSDILNKDFAAIVYLGNKKIFNIHNPSTDADKHWEIRDHFDKKNLHFSIFIYPTQQLLDVTINRTIIYMILFGGFIIALSLGVLIHFWKLAKIKIAEVEEVKKQLLDSEKEQRDTLRSAQIGTWSWDLKTHRAAFFDDYTHVLFGITRNEVEGTRQNLFDRIVPEDRERIQNYFKSCIETGSPIDCIYRIVWANESIHWIVSKGKLFFDDKGKAEKITGISWEITSIKHVQLLLEVSEAISKTLSENAPISETFNKIIQTLYHYLNWSVMILWLINPKTNRLRLASISHIPTIKIPEFEKATRGHHEDDISAPSHIWTTYRPTWYKDVTEDPNFKRSKEAAQEGLKGSFAFPILEGTRVTGVIELFKQKPFVEVVDEGLINLMTSIGIGVGQYMQRKMTEEARAELAAIFTNAQDGIYSLTTDGIIKNWNSGAENIYGWKADEAIGKHISFTYPPDHRDDFERKRRIILSGRSIEHFETQILKKDGSLLWADKTIVSIKDTVGNIIGFASIIQDISSEKEMVDALTVNERKFRDFVEATEEWFWEINNQFIFTYTNPIIKKILGYAPEEIVGMDMRNILKNDSRKEIENQIKNCIQFKEGWSKRITGWKQKDGSTRYLESNAHPIIDEENQVIGFRGADRDITERKRIERTKREFISMVNHELRTPLTSIIGALGLLRSDKELSDKFKELCNIAYRNSERLAGIINDILDIEKLELGKFEFDLKQTSIVEIIDESIVSSIPMAEKFGIKIIKEGPFTDAMVIVDRRRLIQVLMNLLSNAFKFSPTDSFVFISMQIFDTHVRIFIRDQGIGISDEFKSKIFQKFAQADASDSRKVSGTGLGLNICKNLIEGMKGNISFTSKKGEGSTFYFDLPLWKEK
jgi:PAS domain S-box-containing protein